MVHYLKGHEIQSKAQQRHLFQERGSGADAQQQSVCMGDVAAAFPQLVYAADTTSLGSMVLHP